MQIAKRNLAFLATAFFAVVALFIANTRGTSQPFENGNDLVSSVVYGWPMSAVRVCNLYKWGFNYDIIYLFLNAVFFLAIITTVGYIAKYVVSLKYPSEKISSELETKLPSFCKKSERGFFGRPVSASFFLGGIGGFCYAVFGWFEFPEIQDFHVIDYVLVGWLLNCVTITQVPAVVKRSGVLAILGLLSGFALYFLTQWGFKDLDCIGEPRTVFLHLSISLIETGILVSVYLSACFRSSKIMIQCGIIGALSGFILILAHLPYLYLISIDMDSILWQRCLITWVISLCVMMPLVIVLPSWAIERYQKHCLAPQKAILDNE